VRPRRTSNAYSRNQLRNAVLVRNMTLAAMYLFSWSGGRRAWTQTNDPHPSNALCAHPAFATDRSRSLADADRNGKPASGKQRAEQRHNP